MMTEEPEVIALLERILEELARIADGVEPLSATFDAANEKLASYGTFEK